MSLRCEECKLLFNRGSLHGPKPRYCSGACRQAAYLKRKAGVKPEPVLRFAGATMAFRLEAVLGQSTLLIPPEEMVGTTIELNFENVFFKGFVRSVEPYVDPMLGPGHWVVLDNGSIKHESAAPQELGE